MKTIIKITATAVLIILFAFTTANNQNKHKTEDLVLKTETGDIFGQLVYPEENNQVPLVIIIAGSGSTDMDCNTPMFKTNSYKYLAEELANNNIASLRFDKRGIAKSKDAMNSEPELRFGNYVDDVVGWIKWLKNERDFSKLFIAGHSEGSLIGMLAAQKTDISGYISISGVGKPASEIIKEQLKSQPPMVQQDSAPIIESLLAGNTVPDVKPYLMSLFRPSVQSYLISWFKYDPRLEIEKLKVPVLIIQGTTDIQVPVENAELLHQAAKQSELRIIEGMNHILKDAPVDRQQNMASYGQTELPVNVEITTVIEDFIKKNN